MARGLETDPNHHHQRNLDRAMKKFWCLHPESECVAIMTEEELKSNMDGCVEVLGECHALTWEDFLSAADGVLTEPNFWKESVFNLIATP
jgi:hypothetical protein